MNKTCNLFCRINKQLGTSASVSGQAVRQTIWSRTIICSRSIRSQHFSAQSTKCVTAQWIPARKINSR